MKVLLYQPSWVWIFWCLQESIWIYLMLSIPVPISLKPLPKRKLLIHTFQFSWYITILLPCLARRVTKNAGIYPSIGNQGRHISRISVTSWTPDEREWSILCTNEIGHTDIVKHHIITTSEVRIHKKPYQVSPEKQQFVKQEIKVMLDKKIRT